MIFIIFGCEDFVGGDLRWFCGVDDGMEFGWDWKGVVYNFIVGIEDCYEECCVSCEFGVNCY